MTLSEATQSAIDYARLAQRPVDVIVVGKGYDFALPDMHKKQVYCTMQHRGEPPTVARAVPVPYDLRKGLRARLRRWAKAMRIEISVVAEGRVCKQKRRLGHGTGRVRAGGTMSNKRPIYMLHTPIFGFVLRGSDGRMRRFHPELYYAKRRSAAATLTSFVLDHGLDVRCVVVGHWL